MMSNRGYSQSSAVHGRLAEILGVGREGAAGAPLRRIHIVGGAGSGKTTLAPQLARRLMLPVYSLDTINFAGSVAVKRPREQRLADVRRIAAQPAWVTEGVFVGWTDALLQAADLVIWLDLSWPTALVRIVRRHLRQSLAGTNRYPGLRRLVSFLLWSTAYYRNTPPAVIDALDEESLHSRAATARHLAPYTAKLIRCCCTAEVADLLASVTAIARYRHRSAVGNGSP